MWTAHRAPLGPVLQFSVTSDELQSGFKRSRPDFPISNLIELISLPPELDLERLGFVRLSLIIIPDPLDGCGFLLGAAPRSQLEGGNSYQKRCVRIWRWTKIPRAVVFPGGHSLTCGAVSLKQLSGVPSSPLSPVISPIKWHAGEYRPWNRRKDSWKHRPVDKHKCASVCVRVRDYITTKMESKFSDSERGEAVRGSDSERVLKKRRVYQREWRIAWVPHMFTNNRLWSPGRCVLLEPEPKAQTLGSHL